ncbi:unnamed protein product [Dracunculus medinensis]|uniref:C-type lectin domain-containing protein n=1 Tax=Dracunculus medinensis TaxID=318479 RepID=A0A0N4UMI1_DRAME|nr:unnamed protein product [Dracunculus medinensis]
MTFFRFFTTALIFNVAQTQFAHRPPLACAVDNDCRIFEFCFNRQYCPGGFCPLNMVCAGNQCVRDPLAPPSCPDGWTQNDQFKACYIINLGSYNYIGANIECTARGGHVTSVHSHAEMNFINSLTGGSPFWIGLRKHGFVYQWDDGTAVNFTNYRGREPDNCCPRGAAFCTLVNYIGSAGQWDDAGCNEVWRPHQTKIVCKRPLA